MGCTLPDSPLFARSEVLFTQELFIPLLLSSLQTPQVQTGRDCKLILPSAGKDHHLNAPLRPMV